jgi:hypothetical protein
LATSARGHPELDLLRTDDIPNLVNAAENGLNMVLQVISLPIGATTGTGRPACELPGIAMIAAYSWALKANKKLMSNVR